MIKFKAVILHTMSIFSNRFQLSRVGVHNHSRHGRKLYHISFILNSIHNSRNITL